MEGSPDAEIFLLIEKDSSSVLSQHSIHTSEHRIHLYVKNLRGTRILINSVGFHFLTFKNGTMTILKFFVRIRGYDVYESIR